MRPGRTLLRHGTRDAARGGESDLGVYRTQYGLPACTTANGCFSKVNETGGTTYRSAAWSAQSAESLDAISAVCPNCRILLVEATSPSIGDLGVAENEAVNLGATFVDNDWTIPEAEVGSIETSDDTLYFNHQGVAITAPAGNTGYSDSGVNYPAVSPYLAYYDTAPVGGGWSIGSGTDAHSGNLNDVTTGSDGTTCVVAYLCTARPGYDGPTGLGTP